MLIKYDLDIAPEVISSSIKRLINQVYKLLPTREEGSDWEKPLETILEELSGIGRLLIDQQQNIFIILSKLEGLFDLTEEEDFGIYRRVIFETLSLLNVVKENVQLG